MWQKEWIQGCVCMYMDQIEPGTNKRRKAPVEGLQCNIYEDSVSGKYEVV